MSTAAATVFWTNTRNKNVSKEILNLLNQNLGELEDEWEMASGHTKGGSFTIIRYDALKKGTLRRLHAVIEDVLGDELSPGHRS